MLTDAVQIASVRQVRGQGCIRAELPSDRHPESDLLVRYASALGRWAGIDPNLLCHIKDADALESHPVKRSR